MKLFSRRRFLSLGATALGGGFIAARSLNLISPSLLTPTSGAALPTLANINLTQADKGLKTAQINATEAVATVGGIKAKLQTYNGTYPAPLLRLQEGDQVQVQFSNNLKEHTNLHLHGVHISPDEDDPFWHGHPGWSKTYRFDVPTAGTFWYHPHLHGSVASQQFSGLAGVVIAEGALDQLPELQAAEEHVLMLTSTTLNGVIPAEHTFFEQGGKPGDMVLVNGAKQPVLTAQKATLRLRIINASTTRIFNLSVAGHEMHLIATDGGFIEKPVAFKQLELAPGERIDVLVQLDKPGIFALLDGANPLLNIVAPAKPEPTPLPDKLATLERLPIAKATVTHRLKFGFNPPIQFTIDGNNFDHNRIDVQSKVGELEIWEIYNGHHDAHPFHLHSYPVQVIDRNGVPEPFTAWRDVINIHPKETVRLAIPFRDYAGRTVYHCHISEHEDNGMMGIIEVTN